MLSLSDPAICWPAGLCCCVIHAYCHRCYNTDISHRSNMISYYAYGTISHPVCFSIRSCATWLGTSRRGTLYTYIYSQEERHRPVSFIYTCPRPMFICRKKLPLIPTAMNFSWVGTDFRYWKNRQEKMCLPVDCARLHVRIVSGIIFVTFI